MVQKSGDQVGSLSHYLQGLYIPFYCLGFLPSTVWTSKTSASSGNKGMLQIRRANPWEECARLWAAKPQCWAQKFRSTVMLRTWWYTKGSHSCWFVHRSIRTNCLANWQMNKKKSGANMQFFNPRVTCHFLLGWDYPQEVLVGVSCHSSFFAPLFNWALIDKFQTGWNFILAGEQMTKNPRCTEASIFRHLQFGCHVSI